MFSTLTRNDMIWLICASALMAFCGVFGCSYVIGQGWPALELWAEILLTMVFTPIACVVLLLFDKALIAICQASAASAAQKGMTDAALRRVSSKQQVFAPMRERSDGATDLDDSDNSDNSDDPDNSDTGTNPGSPDTADSPDSPDSPDDSHRPSSLHAGMATSSSRPASKLPVNNGLFSVMSPKWTVRSILLFTLIMCACWAIWYVANFPGGAYWDTYYQIFQVYPENHPISIIPWSDVYNKTLTDAWLVDHHPVLVTMIYGAFGWVSDQLTGNWMAGVAIFCALQGILSCAVFTSACAYLRSRGCPSGVCFASYLFFAFIPFVPTWAMCMVKDSMFAIAFIPYMMMLIETAITQGKWLERRSHRIWMIVIAVFLCLIKKQAIFVVVATSVAGFFAFRIKEQREKRGVQGQEGEREKQEERCEDKGVHESVRQYDHEACVVQQCTHEVRVEHERNQVSHRARQGNMNRMQVTFVLQSVFSLVLICVVLPCILFPILNIEKGGMQEMLGPAFQQTARALVDFPDDVTDEERDAIASVLDIDKIIKDYSFDFEDAVKYRYNLNATSEDVFNYLQVYLSQGLRHPDSYFGAWMSLAGFYVAPCAYVNIRMTTVDTKMGDEQRYMLWNPDGLDWLREGLDDAYKAIASIPVIDAPLLLVAYTFWLPLALMFVCVRRKVSYSGTMHWMLAFIPVLVLCAFCYIAPVYDARYAIPVFDAAPLLFGFVCSRLAFSSDDATEIRN